MNLRDQAVKDARELNIRDWGQPVRFLAPDGKIYEHDALDPEPDLAKKRRLEAPQVLYDKKKINPATGEETTVSAPVVVMSRANMERVPRNGEKWLVQMPKEPGGPMVWFGFSETKATEGGRSLGLIRIYLQELDQSESPGGGGEGEGE